MSYEYFSGRTCSICGSPITDDNPDGIGYTCREVHDHATMSAFYHFKGLDFWAAKCKYWVTIYLDAFKTTKFRSDFRKNFYQSISVMTEIRLSKKQLEIIKDSLIGSYEITKISYPKLSEMARKNAIDGEDSLLKTMRSDWLSRPKTTEELDYISNLTKKYYNEKRLVAIK